MTTGWCAFGTRTTLHGECVPARSLWRSFRSRAERAPELLGADRLVWAAGDQPGPLGPAELAAGDLTGRTDLRLRVHIPSGHRPVVEVPDDLAAVGEELGVEPAVAVGSERLAEQIPGAPRRTGRSLSRSPSWRAPNRPGRSSPRRHSRCARSAPARPATNRAPATASAGRCRCPTAR